MNHIRILRSHISVGLGKVFRERSVGMGPRYCPELECGSLSERAGDARVVQPAQLMEFFPGDHERGQVGRVYS